MLDFDKMEGGSDIDIKNFDPLKVPFPGRDEPLHLAVVMGKCGRIRRLVHSGQVPVDQPNMYGQTGLYLASILGKKHVVVTLLRLGADPNARNTPDWGQFAYTPMHGACYVGSTKVLKVLIIAGGDLRLCDKKRMRPLDWVDFQGDPKKRRETRDFVERLRFCIMKQNKEDMRMEFKDKMIKYIEPLYVRIWRKLTSCGNSNREILENDFTTFSMTSTGFGKAYFAGGSKWVEAINLPNIAVNNDLTYDDNPRAPSWICGKFTTFIPMVWTQRNVAVTVRELRWKSVDEAVADILIAEMKVLTRLQHPNILTTMAICQEDNFDSLAIVFEKISLGSLYFFLHQQNLRMKPAFATEIVIQISEALDYIHGSGFVHCGISSHSVMLVAENRAKLACFEYAMPEDQALSKQFIASRHPWLTSDSHLSVIRHWVAPEIIVGTHSYSQASDVYSLCCVMWEMMVGEVPWKDYDLLSLRTRTMLRKNCTGELLLRKDSIPPLWLSVLQVGLRSNREERDLDFKEVRYMMTLAKERASTSLMGAVVGASGDRQASRTSLMKSSTSNATSTTQVSQVPIFSLFGQGDYKSRTNSKISRTVSFSSSLPSHSPGIDAVDKDTVQENKDEDEETQPNDAIIIQEETDTSDDEGEKSIPFPAEKANKVYSTASLPRSYKSQAFIEI